MALQEYWGLQSIATRLSLSRPSTALDWYRRYGIPMYLRRRGNHPRKIWYTHEGLLQKWELVFIKEQREAFLAKPKRQVKGPQTKFGR